MVENMFSLQNRHILVTGAGGHLGIALSHAISKLGGHLYLVDKDRAALENLESSLPEGEYQSFVGDLESENDRQSLIDWMSDSTKLLDGIVHNAAFVGASDLTGWSEPFEEQSVESFRRAIEVNLVAPFHLTQGLVPLLRKSSGPSIVSIGSLHGVVGPDWNLYAGLPMASPAAYAAGKAGLIQFTAWLSTTLAPHIRANSVSPGGIDRSQPGDFVSRYSARTPLGRLAREQDVVGAVIYLLSDASAYVTGQNLVIDGGYSVW